MPANINKPDRWKRDVAQSVDFYNRWFMAFAPRTFREARIAVTQKVEAAIQNTENLTLLTPQTLQAVPNVVQMLRMATAPPIALDRLSGLAYVSRSLIKRMEEKGQLPARLSTSEIHEALSRICAVISQLLDHDVFPWLSNGAQPSQQERERAATIVADRLTGAIADPILRNTQEQRQLKTIEIYLTQRGYSRVSLQSSILIQKMHPGTFTFRHNVTAATNRRVTIPIDVIVQPVNPRRDRVPVLIEAKSAGDFANTNKRRKEEATKMRQLQETFGESVPFILFLNGYFDTPYLGYEAAEGIDWVWEHRLEDFEEFGI
jgi:hypothetical protein